MNRKSLLAGLLSLWAAIAALPAWAAEPDAGKERAAAAEEKSGAQQAVGEKPADGDKAAEETPRYVRVRRNDAGDSVAMETAIIRFVPDSDKSDAEKAGVTVDLIGAVHVGDRSYYDELNKLFDEYDVVLYELVAPEGTRIPKEGRKGSSGHPIGALQNGMSAMLELDHQLDRIDYTKEKLVHADLSPEEFNKTMEKRGESFYKMFLHLMGQGMAQQAAGTGGSSDFAILMALFSKDRALKLKIAMADQFEDLEGQMLAIEGPEGSTIISERNKRAFEVLEKQIKAGKKKIGVFYGAGHFPDMEKRLLKDFGLKRDSEKWLVAWKLEKPKAEDAKTPPEGLKTNSKPKK